MESKKLYGELRDKIAGSPEVQRKVTAHIRAKHGHSTLPSFNDDGVDEATKVQTYQDCIQAVVTGNFDALVGQTSEPRKRKVIGAAPATLQRGSDEPSAAFVPVSDPTFKINPATLRLFDAIFKAALDSPQNGALIVGPHGCGKCLKKGTPVLMHDGTIKPVEDIVIGDELMGPDSIARIVASVTSGTDQMYKVTPKKGEPYVVNSQHVLSLRKCGTKELVNIEVGQYLKSSKEFKIRHLGWRSAVDFEPKELNKHMPPYILGMWLGDGHTNASGFRVSKPDPEIRQSLSEYAASLGCKISLTAGPCPTISVIKEHKGIGKNPALEALRELGVHGHRDSIPFAYKTGSYAQRVELLAGLLDTDGHLYGNNCYEFTSKHETLADDTAYVARSLGLAAYKSPKVVKGVTYWRITISGDTTIVPCRIKRKQAKPRRQEKNALHVGIKVEPIGNGEYFGFSLEPTGGEDNRLFLLGDFTVTHNSSLPGEFAARHGMKHLIMDCANIREPRDWFGYKTAVDGTVFWHESEFARCVEKGHHAIQFDEITRVSDAIKNTLFPLLDHRRFTYLEERGDVIRVGPGTIFFATMNEGSGYTGCTSIDLALKDRFTRRIEVNYLSTEDETEVLVARTGIKRSDAKKLVELADIIRKKATGVGATITQSVSTRQLLACAADFQQLGMDALEYTITNHFSADGASDSERAQVLQMVQGKFPAK